MAGALGLLLGGRVRAVLAPCGFATRGVAGPGPVGREPDPDSDWEPEERELQEVASALKRQEKAIRFQKIRRQMEAPGAPPRTLTREAMEQIRYLHKEFAESWSVPRLAEGFEVSTDVIRRVLRSKFVPTLEQKLKQDHRVLEKAGLAHSLRQLPGPGRAWKLPPTCHSVSGGEASCQGQGHSTALKVMEPSTHSADPPRRQQRRNDGVRSLQEESCVSAAAAGGRRREPWKRPTLDCEGPGGAEGAGLPGAVGREGLRAGEQGGQNFSSRAVQRGREFFDDHGNFLYRI